MADGDDDADDALGYVVEQAALTPRYLLYMTLAGVLAGVGLLSNSVPILVGSMIIAPALPPVALVAFGIVHRRPSLAARGAGVAALGLGAAAVAAVAVGVLMRVTDVIPPGTDLLAKPMLEERVRPGWWSLAAALAGGVVGVVALTEKKTDTLIGTVAALALVPAGAAAGIAALATDVDRALGGLLLLGMNFAMIVAMGIVALAVLRREAARLPLAIAAALIAGTVLLVVIAHSSGVTPGRPPAIQTSQGLCSVNDPAGGAGGDLRTSQPTPARLRHCLSRRGGRATEGSLRRRTWRRVPQGDDVTPATRALVSSTWTLVPAVVPPRLRDRHGASVQ